MGHGAPKRFDSISTESMVAILAAEGNVEASWRDLSKAIGRVFENQDEVIAWQEVERLREQYYNRVRFLNALITSLIRKQNKI